MASLTNRIIMIRPTRFGFNEESFKTNSFQNRSDLPPDEIQKLALQEFDSFVARLNDVGISVKVFEDLPDSSTPDSIFPNNWFSTHVDKKMILYPMAVENRRDERRPDIIQELVLENNYDLLDFTESENMYDPKYLEGTGSLIFDHANNIVFAAISPRTDESLIAEIANTLKITPVTFKAYGKENELIYHTNVMLAMGDEFAVLGSETIDQMDRQKVISYLKQLNKEIIYMTNDQIFNGFAGNMLQLKNTHGENVMVMSSKAYASLSKDQLEQFKQFNQHIVQANIPTIEFIGGGSARCMIAELF